MKTRTQINLNLLVPGIVILALFLLLSGPTSNRFSLLLYLVGGVVCFAVTAYSVHALWIGWQALQALLRPAADPQLTDTAEALSTVDPEPVAVSQPAAAPRPLGLQYLLLVSAIIFALVAGLVWWQAKPGNFIAFLASYANFQLQVTLALAILAALLHSLLDMQPPAIPEADQTSPDAPVADGSATPQKLAGAPVDPVNWVVMFSRAVLRALEALVMLPVKTIMTLLPVAARKDDPDKAYNKQIVADYCERVNKLELDDAKKQTICGRWIEQIEWTSNRANRERDANEIFRWWQILLSASIPVMTTVEAPFGMQDYDATLWAAIAGATVAILTALQQYRRPEERWRHYRIICERYQQELWDYISLNKSIYPDMNHDGAYQQFYNRMKRIQDEDLFKFFSQVFPSQQSLDLIKQPESGPTSTGSATGSSPEATSQG